MFDGLTGMDWLFIVAALALGFGVVKFMLVAKPGQKAAVPSVQPGGERSIVPGSAVGGSGQSAEQSARTDGDMDEGRPDWFEVLGVERTATEKQIEQAFARKWSTFAPGKYISLMTDLSFIADGGLDEAMPKQLELRSMKLAVTAQQLKSMLGSLLHDMEAARDEGLMRRRRGLMD